MLATVAVGGVVAVGLSAFFLATSSFVLAAVLLGLPLPLGALFLSLDLASTFSSTAVVGALSTFLSGVSSTFFATFLGVFLTAFLGVFLTAFFLSGTVSTAGSGLPISSSIAPCIAAVTCSVGAIAALASLSFLLVFASCCSPEG